MAVCGIVGATAAASPFTYADTTASGDWTVAQGQKDPAREYMTLQDSIGRYFSGVPVKWASNNPQFYDINPARFLSVGVAWIVGTVEYAGLTLRDSVGVQVVAGPTLADCK
jgi:hypothetical protein